MAPVPAGGRQAAKRAAALLPGPQAIAARSAWLFADTRRGPGNAKQDRHGRTACGLRGINARAAIWLPAESRRLALRRPSYLRDDHLGKQPARLGVVVRRGDPGWPGDDQPIEPEAQQRRALLEQLMRRADRCAT